MEEDFCVADIVEVPTFIIVIVEFDIVATSKLEEI